MALSTPAVLHVCAPGLLAALQQLQHVAGVTSLRSVCGVASVPDVPRRCAVDTQATISQSMRPKWQTALARQLITAPVRYGSTFTPMTMDPAFATTNTTCQDLVTAISGFVTQPVDERSASLPRLAEQLVHYAPELPPEDIARVAVAFARMGFTHTGLASALATQVTLRMPLCSPEAIAQTAWAFGELQYYNYQFLDQLVQHLKQNYTSFSAPDLARVLWALGKLSYTSDVLVDLWHELALKASSQLDCKGMVEVVVAEAMSGTGSTDDVTLQNMIADYTAANLSSFDGEDLGKVVYGLARFSYEDAELYDMMAKRAVEIWDTLTPVDIRRIMTAYADLGFFNQALLDCVADKWLVAHLDDPDLHMPELRLIVRAFNVLGYSNPHIADAIKERMVQS